MRVVLSGDRYAVAGGNQPTAARNTAQLPLWLFIVVLSGVVALVVVVLVCMICRRNKHHHHTPRPNMAPARAAHHHPVGGQGHQRASDVSCGRYQHDYAKLHPPPQQYQHYSSQNFNTALSNNGVPQQQQQMRYADTTLPPMVVVGGGGGQRVALMQPGGPGSFSDASLKYSQQQSSEMSPFALQHLSYRGNY